MTIKTNALFVCALTTLSAIASGCTDRPDRADIEQLMKDLEQFGAGQRDCIGSTWLANHQPELFKPGGGDLLRKVESQEGKLDCDRTLRLVREVTDERGLFRTYRCMSAGHDLEISYSAYVSSDKLSLSSWCEYAIGVEAPLEETGAYTFFRDS